MSGGQVVGVDHVQVAAPHDAEAEARGFYGGLLGLRELAKPPDLAARGGVWFACGAQELHVGIEEPFAPARKAHPALRVEGLEALAERLVGAGVEVRWDAAVPGVARCFVDDPWGNRLELVAAQGARVTPG
jgi:catechol 2,3-dioxygenase-like lactoylglutathione lyase family enzyme